MRKTRDYDAELKALEQRARGLRERKLRQLGELMIATGADALDVNMLAGGLLAMVSATDDEAKEGWRARGAAFFRDRTRKARDGVHRDTGGAAAVDDSAEQA